YCGVPSCPRASLPPSRSLARPTYEVSRAEFRRQDPGDEYPGLVQNMEDSSPRLVVDLRLSIADLRSARPSVAARQYTSQGQDCSILNRKSTIDNCQGSRGGTGV